MGGAVQRTPAVFVTGAGGFVGGALCREGARRGWRMIAAVRSSDAAAVLPRGIEVRVSGDLAARADWEDLLAGAGTVVHLAARVHRMEEADEGALAAYRKINVEGTGRLAEAAAKAGAARFIFASTVKVHGEGSDHPYREDSVPSPQDPYAVSKWEAERLLEEIAGATGLEVVVLRLPLVYGPGVGANFLRMMKLVARGVPLPLGGVTNRRSMLYLGNLVDAIALCAQHPSAAGETFLAADSRDVSTPELIRLLAGAMGRRPRLFSCPPSLLEAAGRLIGRGGEMGRLTGSLFVDGAKLRGLLGWHPPFSLEQGIGETVAWHLGKTRHEASF